MANRKLLPDLDTFHWHVDPRAKPPSMDKDDLAKMQEMLEFKYTRSLEHSMQLVNQTADDMYHNATYSTATSFATSSPFERLVSKMSYKPNARLWVESDHMLVICMDCPDRENPKEMIPIMSRQEIPDSMIHGDDSTEQMVDWIRNCIRQLEEHEMNEWIRLDKRLVSDPHVHEIQTNWVDYK